MQMLDDPGPVLAKVPDARLAPFPMAPAIGLLYLSLLIGIVPTMLVLLVSALALRRVRLAAAAVGIGLLGFVAPVVPILAYTTTGAEPNYPLIFFGARLLSVALGFWAYKLAVPHFRGHVHLEGKELPLLWVIGPAFAVLFLLPSEVVLLLVLPFFPFVAAVAG